MRVALIGGSGFIGTELTPLLQKQGHEIIIGDIEKSEAFPSLWRFGDIREAKQMEDICRGCDAIINLAAVHHDDVRPLTLYYDTNVRGSEVLCEVAEKLNIAHIIFTSSVAVYGFQTGEPDEDTPHQPFNEYGKTKSQAEDVYYLWHRHAPTKRTLTIIRPTVVFGPDNRGNVYNLLKQLASGAFIMIGNGQNRKSMAYVENVAAFIAYSLSFKTGTHIYNYVDKPDFTMNKLVRTVRQALGKGDSVGLRLPYFVGYLAGTCFDILARLTGKRFPVSRIRIQKFCSNTIFSAEKAHSSGFKAPRDLGAALEKTISHEFGAKSE